ncbi:MAG: hypothetical protein C0498_10790 [Anaerolinea sp.]|nr:hypothetical protein [Anaerolinea sp.]
MNLGIGLPGWEPAAAALRIGPQPELDGARTSTRQLYEIAHDLDLYGRLFLIKAVPKLPKLGSRVGHPAVKGCRSDPGEPGCRRASVARADR